MAPQGEMFAQPNVELLAPWFGAIRPQSLEV